MLLLRRASRRRRLNRSRLRLNSVVAGEVEKFSDTAGGSMLILRALLGSSLGEKTFAKEEVRCGMAFVGRTLVISK